MEGSNNKAIIADGWPHTNPKGKPLKHWENTEWLCLKNGVSFRYNQLTKKVEAQSPALSKLSPDAVVTELRGLGEVEGYTVSRQDMADHILRMAENNAYNPVKEYLMDCLDCWDGQAGRIRELFSGFSLAPSGQDPEFLYTLFEKWLITCALLPFNEGTDAAQGVFILIGPQGIGKTRFLYKLLPISKWGKTGRMLDLRDKDTVIQALGYWIVELGEYGRNITAEKSDSYKSFVTDATDTFRTPYARESQEHPRTTVFYATTDNDTFLKDDAGERRNWAMKITGFKDIKIDMGQFWGEVAHLALVERRPHWLTQEEIDRLNLQNEGYKVRSAEYEILFDAFDWEADKREWLHLRATELCEAVGLNPQKSVVHVGRALTQMKHLGVIRDTDTSRKKYTVPPLRNRASTAWLKQNEGRWGHQSEAIG